MLKELENNKMEVQAFYIIGLIDDTEDSINKTIKYSHKINSFTAQFCVLTPYPGTNTFNELNDKLLTKDFSLYTEYNPVVKIEGVRPERLRQLLNKAYNSYYFRFSWIIKNGSKAIIGFITSKFQVFS